MTDERITRADFESAMDDMMQAYWDQDQGSGEAGRTATARIEVARNTIRAYADQQLDEGDLWRELGPAPEEVPE